MPVTTQAFLVAKRLEQGLTDGDTDILNRVMRIDVQITLGFDLKINQTMTGDLIKHVIKERNISGEFTLTRPIQIQTNGDLGFEGISGDFSLPHGGTIAKWQKNYLSVSGSPRAPKPINAHDTISGFRASNEPTMSQYWSSLVHSLTPYVPGEQPKLPNLVKLNTNENPYPPSPLAVAAMAGELGANGDSLRLYPDPNADLLKEAVAAYFADCSITAQQVFVGNGSDEVLAHAFMALLKHDAPILYPDITYSFYPVYCGLYGVDYVSVPLDDNFQIHVDDYRQKNGGIIFPNPNAPTGCLLPLADIEKLLLWHPQSVIVVDEAYVDFGGESAVTLVNRYPNLLVVHTLSKSRSLAGLRVGYAVGHVDLIEALERVKNSFNSYPLDRLAIAGAAAAMADRGYFNTTCQAVIQSRETLTAELQALGFDVLPSAANFIFTRHPKHDAAQLAAALRNRSIIVRHFKLPRIDQHLRITIGNDAQCAALVRALTEILA
jgi:histidinol-phosphate aminotransferase